MDTPSKRNELLKDLADFIESKSAELKENQVSVILVASTSVSDEKNAVAVCTLGKMRQVTTAMVKSLEPDVRIELIRSLGGYISTEGTPLEKAMLALTML